jgi:hypothetical protein
VPQAPDNSTFKSRLEKKLKRLDEEICTLEAQREMVLQDIFRLKGRCHTCERMGARMGECNCNPKLSGNVAFVPATKEASRVDS